MDAHEGRVNGCVIRRNSHISRGGKNMEGYCKPEHYGHGRKRIDNDANNQNDNATKRQGVTAGETKPLISETEGKREDIGRRDWKSNPKNRGYWG